MGKRVLLIANDCTTILNFRMELVMGLIDAGNTVAVALPENVSNSTIQALGCQLFHIIVDRKGRNPIKDLNLIFQIMKVLDKFKPDIVYTFTIKPNVYGGIACRLKHIGFVPTITGLGSSIQNGGLSSKISLGLYKIGLHKAKCVLFQNIANRDLMLQENVYHGEYSMIPGSGVNLTKYPLMEYPDTDTVHFVYVSRIMKEKGIDEYLESAKYIKSKYSNTVFHICGSYEDDYKDKIQELEAQKIIIYHGLVRNMADIYKSVHCIIHPSYHEGMANVLLESAACGKVIITSNIHGCMEAVEDGKTGFLVNVKDTESLIKAVERFLQLPFDTRRAMGIAGRKKMEREFDRNMVVRQYLNLL